MAPLARRPLKTYFGTLRTAAAAKCVRGSSRPLSPGFVLRLDCEPLHLTGGQAVASASEQMSPRKGPDNSVDFLQAVALGHTAHPGLYRGGMWFESTAAHHPIHNANRGRGNPEGRDDLVSAVDVDADHEPLQERRDGSETRGRPRTCSVCWSCGRMRWSGRWSFPATT